MQTDRPGQRQRQWLTDRHVKAEAEADRPAHRQAEAEAEAEAKAGAEADRQANRQAEAEAEAETDRPTGQFIDCAWCCSILILTNRFVSDLLMCYRLNGSPGSHTPLGQGPANLQPLELNSFIG